MVEAQYGVHPDNIIFREPEKVESGYEHFSERVTVQVDALYAADMRQEDEQKMLETFHTNGLVILDFEQPETPEIVRENLLSLSHFFGRMEGHKHAKGGIVDITTTPGVYKADGVRRPQSDNGHQSPHSDGVFGETPPIIALGCYRPAAEGGESMYVDMQQVFGHLWKTDMQALATLFLPNAATVIRGDQKKKGPVFSYQDERVQAFFSNHEYNETEVNGASKKGYSMLDTYVKNNENQVLVPTEPGSITIFDNMRMLHGRQGFTDAAGKERWLMRTWFNGNTPYMQNTPRGFNAPL